MGTRFMDFELLNSSDGRFGQTRGGGGAVEGFRATAIRNASICYGYTRDTRHSLYMAQREVFDAHSSSCLTLSYPG